MSTAAEEIKASALRLSDKERADLAYCLIESLNTKADEDAEEAWDAEFARREAEIRDGKVQGELADVVMARILKKIS
jgi:putative addiction module component (TIGR02574 family)